MLNLKKGSAEWKVLGAVILHAAKELNRPMSQEAVNAYIKMTGQQPPQLSEEETFESVLTLLDKGLLVVWFDGEMLGINSVVELKKEGLIPKDYNPELNQYGKLFTGEYKNIWKDGDK